MHKKPQNYIRLPLFIRQTVELTGDEKLLYGEIEALSRNDQQICYASNAYFAFLYNCSERTIRRRIENLVLKGYIHRVLTEMTHQRFLQPILQAAQEECSDSPQYSFIPSEIRFNKNLTAGEKLLYGEIFTLSNNKFGKCWVENAYFENLFSLSKPTLKRYFRSLIAANYIYKEMIVDELTCRQKRILGVNCPLTFTIPKEERPLQEGVKSVHPQDQPCQEGGQICPQGGSDLSAGGVKSVHHNNIATNNINNNLSINLSSSSQKSETEELESSKSGHVFKINWGIMNPAIAHELDLLEKEYGVNVMLYALNRIRAYGVQPRAAFKYLNTMIANWKKQGLNQLETIKQSDQSHRQSLHTPYKEVQPEWFKQMKRQGDGCSPVTNKASVAIAKDTALKLQARIAALQTVQ